MKKNDTPPSHNPEEEAVERARARYLRAHRCPDNLITGEELRRRIRLQRK